MQNPIIVFTDKVMAMIKSMVFVSMSVYYRRGATAEEISGFLNARAPSGDGIYHEGIVERVLQELRNDGVVTRAGARWYPVGRSG